MKRFLTAALTITLLSGCNLFFPAPDGGGEGNKAALKPFGSEQELADYFSAQIHTQNSLVSVPSRNEVQGGADGDAVADTGGSGNAPAAPTAESSDEAASSFSGTTVQEVGVDEADVVKSDGTYLYVIQNNYDREGSSLKIVRADQMAVVGEIALSGYPRELYLHGSRIVALTETYGNYYYLDGPVTTDPRPIEGTESIADVEGSVTEDDAPVSEDGSGGSDLIAPPDEGISPPFVYSRPKTIVTVIDAAVPSAASRVSQTEFDGTQSSSRMIDGMLHMVVSNYQNYYFDILPALGRPEMEGQEADPDEVLPRYRHIDAQGLETEGPVVTWENVYRPEVPDGFGVLAVVSMDADNSDTFRAFGVVAEPGLIYSSLEALYVTNTNYDFSLEERSTTDVYKFRYTDDGAAPVAAGRVRGRILNQYAMSESEGFLRIATTTDRVFSANGEVESSLNHVYVLGESNGALNVVGRLENLAPGETIQSARFIGDRGYLVTFEQIDPLFTLDLADPANPKAVGVLKVPGFSTYMMPMGEDHLLTVGVHIPEGGAEFFRPWGVQLTIFDVSDFTTPTLAHQVVIGGDTWVNSEAQYNPKAFNYFVAEGLIALPVSISEPYIFDDGGMTVTDVDVDGVADGGGGSSGSEGGDGMVTKPPVDGDDGSDGNAVIDESEPVFEPYIPGGFDGLYVYRVSTETGFTELGRISTRFEEAGHFYANYTRGVFIGLDVYAVTDNGVHSAPVAALNGPARELLLRASNPYYNGEATPVDDGGETVIDDNVLEDGVVSEPDAPEPGWPIGASEK